MKKIYTIKTNLNEKDAEALLDKVNEPALKEALSKAEPPQGKLVKLIFKDNAAERIERLLEEHECDAAKFFAALEVLSKITSQEENLPSPMTAWLSHSQRQPREGQHEFYEHILTSLKKEKIGLCEASTGAGKTAAILAALSDAIKGTGERGLICTPAVALVRDFAVEHNRLGPAAPKLRIFLGMGEFISESELNAFIDTWTGFDEQVIAIRQWLNNGAKPMEVGISQCYLKHTLRLISPDIPLEEVLLKDDMGDDDGGLLAYREQFNKEHDVEGVEEILLCSHAMLAVDLRTRLAVAARSEKTLDAKAHLDSAWKAVKFNKEAKQDTSDALYSAKLAQEAWDQSVMDSSEGRGKLPEYSYLVVDEAHLLEQSFSNSLSSYVAIHQFTIHAKNLSQQGLLTKAAVTDIEKAYYSLCHAAKLQQNDNIQISHLNSDILTPLSQLVSVSKAGLSKISKKRMDSIDPNLLRKLNLFKNDIMSINQAAHANSGQIAYINLSPRLAYPRLFVGRASVEQYLRFLWSSVKGAACVSATLYIPKEDGLSSWYTANILSIPNDRKMDFTPIKPEWISSTICEINMPSCELVNGRIPLKPASRGQRLSEDEKEESDNLWCQEVADAIAKIYDSAAGGCLVLMTSYASVNSVKSILLNHPGIAPNLIYAQQGEMAKKDKAKTQPITISEQQRKFLQLASQGKKPIWLGLGNAWTGINLSGGDPMKDMCGIEIPAEEDNVLTDLIIPRLPFGINKSVTHAYRMTHKKTVPWERIDTLLRLRQGVGRLVRRYGVPKNRRVHLLDARLCEGTLANMMNVVKKAIGC